MRVSSRISAHWSFFFFQRRAVIYCASLKKKKKKAGRINLHLMVCLGSFLLYYSYYSITLHSLLRNIEHGVGCGWEYLRGL